MHVAEKNLITIVFHVKTEFIQHRYINNLSVKISLVKNVEVLLVTKGIVNKN